jgi:hypothetical protein
MFTTSYYNIWPKYSIEKFGVDLYCLKQQNESEFYGGHDVASTLYFSLADLSEIFSFLRYYSDNSTQVLENEDMYTEETKIKIIKTKPIYTIELVTTKIIANERKPKLKKKRTYRTIYKYSRKNRKYVKASH